MMTSLLVSSLGILYFYFSFQVIKGRRNHQIALGMGENNQIQGLVSAHSNFAAYVPMLIILIYLLEHQHGVTPWLLGPFSMVIFIGRVLHFKALSAQNPIDKKTLALRIIGMQCTLFPLMFLSVCLMVLQIRSLLL